MVGFNCPFWGGLFSVIDSSVFSYIVFEENEKGKKASVVRGGWWGTGVICLNFHMLSSSRY